LPLYPSEILPLFLYLGDKRHAYNAALNYELKIRSHVNASRELYTAFPGSINELHIEIDDNPDVDILLKFKEACDYIGQPQSLYTSTKNNMLIYRAVRNNSLL
jgi:hypothetical protein